MKYYKDNAENYYHETVGLENIAEPRKHFLSYIPKNSHILDLGCGSGRDSLYFKQQGHTVTALDQSKELAEFASQLISQTVAVNSYQKINYTAQFDAVWACASLLHCPKSEIIPVFKNVIQALKPEGVWYMSFKYGTTETVDSRGRFFNNYTPDTLQELVSHFKALLILETWIETSELRGHQQQWVNMLVKKV